MVLTFLLYLRARLYPFRMSWNLTHAVKMLLRKRGLTRETYLNYIAFGCSWVLASKHVTTCPYENVLITKYSSLIHPCRAFSLVKNLVTCWLYAIESSLLKIVINCFSSLSCRVRKFIRRDKRAVHCKTVFKNDIQKALSLKWYRFMVY